MAGVSPQTAAMRNLTLERKYIRGNAALILQLKDDTGMLVTHVNYYVICSSQVSLTSLSEASEVIHQVAVFLVDRESFAQ